MKNMFLKTMAVIMLVIFIVSGSALETLDWRPTIVCAISLAYLTIFAYANNFFRRSKERK